MMNLDAEHNLANKFLGYTGEKSRPALDGFYKSNPGAAARMGEYSKAITGMAKGGYYGGYTGIPGGERGRTPPSVAPKQEVVRPKARPTPAPTPKPVSQPNVPTIRPRARPTEAQNISFASSYPEPKSITTFTDNSGATVAESTDSKTTTINRSSQSGDNLIRQAIELNVPIEFSENGQSASVSNATMEKLATSKFGIKSGMLMAEHKRRNPAGGYSSFHLAVGPEGNLNIFDPKNMNVTGGKMKVGYESTFNQGGAVRGYVEGGDNISYTEDVIPQFGETLEDTMSPMQSEVSNIGVEEGTEIGSDVGQVDPSAPTATPQPVGDTELADTTLQPPTSTYGAQTSYTEVKDETGELEPSQGEITEESQVDAAQQDKSSVSDLKAAEGVANIMENPVQREIQDGELISGAADASKAAKFAEQIQAAEALPSEKATVQGQLEGLMQQFEGGATPAWAAGAMRNAMGAMAARGLSSSSMAGQALIQAAMESALPIAQADAQTVASFESQNLSNRQQRAMLAAQQRAAFIGQEFDQAFQARVQNSARIGDIANMNFTAEQNIALENSRAVNTMNLANLGNRQAMVMAEAAALSQLDISNLNNRQQAAVQNAQSFLQMDMVNLANAQQTAMFKAQQNIQALFTDQAASNAAAQFNASSENQANQFFSQLSNQTSQFNAAQTNAMAQFDTNQINSIRQFNANLQNQRDQFNANNGLVIAQANAQWRQNIATLNTAAQNESNMNYAKTINSLTSSNLDQIWQRERDLMQYNFTSAESAKDRALSILMGDKELEALKKELGYKEDTAKTHLLFRFLFGSGETGFLG
jgi:hypothetical protein